MGTAVRTDTLAKLRLKSVLTCLPESSPTYYPDKQARISNFFLLLFSGRQQNNKLLTFSFSLVVF